MEWGVGRLIPKRLGCLEPGGNRKPPIDRLRSLLSRENPAKFSAVLRDEEV